MDDRIYYGQSAYGAASDMGQYAFGDKRSVGASGDFRGSDLWYGGVMPWGAGRDPPRTHRQ